MNVASDYGKTKKLLLEFEDTIGGKLPEEYRNHLVHNEGKLPSPAIVEFLGIDGHTNAVIVRSLFRLDSTDADNIKQNYVFYVVSGRIEKGYIPIAEDVGGNVLCIGMNADNRGKLFFWDHELEVSDKAENLAFACESFNELLAACNNGL